MLEDEKISRFCINFRQKWGHTRTYLPVGSASRTSPSSSTFLETPLAVGSISREETWIRRGSPESRRWDPLSLQRSFEAAMSLPLAVGNPEDPSAKCSNTPETLPNTARLRSQHPTPTVSSIEVRSMAPILQATACGSLPP